MIKNIYILLVLTGIPSLYGMEQSSLIKINAIQKSHQLGDISLYKARHGFQIVNQNKVSIINPAFIDSLLLKMTSKQLVQFQKHGYIDIAKMHDGSYSLKAKVNGNGGGPLTGMFLYWVTKAVAYGGIGAAASAGIAATGGAAASAIGLNAGASAMVGGAASGAATTAVASSLPALGMVGANAVSGAIVTSASATAAATTATGAAVAASGGCIATLIGGIEAAAAGIGALGTAIPFLP